MKTHTLVVVTLLSLPLARPALAQTYGWDFSSKTPAAKATAALKEPVTSKKKEPATSTEIASAKTAPASKEKTPSTGWDFSEARPADAVTAPAEKPVPTSHAATPAASHVATPAVAHSAPAPKARAAVARDLKPAGVHLMWGEPPAASHDAVGASGGVAIQWNVGDAGRASPAAVEATVKAEPIAPEPVAVAAAPATAPEAAPAVEPAAAPTPSAAATADAPAGAEVVLVPGRPGFTESRGVVPAGAIQFEGGYAFTADETDGIVSRTSNVPGAVVRVGLDGRTEFRIASAGLTRQTQTSVLGRSQSSGFGDVQIGMKIMALRERDAHVEVGVVPMVSIPSRVSPVSSFGYDPSLTISFGRALPKGFDATGLVRGAWLTVGGARAMQYSGSVSVGHAIWNGWGGSAEMFTLSDPVTGAPQWNLGTAVARQLGRRLQIDFDLGHSLNFLAPTWTFGAGFVVR